jgi:antirestriction protein ArdC
VLREDIRAASQASKEADWILGYLPADDQAESFIDGRAA